MPVPHDDVRCLRSYRYCRCRLPGLCRKRRLVDERAQVNPHGCISHVRGKWHALLGLRLHLSMPRGSPYITATVMIGPLSASSERYGSPLGRLGSLFAGCVLSCPSSVGSGSPLRTRSVLRCGCATGRQDVYKQGSPVSSVSHIGTDGDTLGNRVWSPSD